MNGNGPKVQVNGADNSENRYRSPSAEKTLEPLMFVTLRQRNAVSRREDDTDKWGIDELDSKEEHRLVLRDNDIRSMILARLNTFRRNRELCDVILFVKEREILAHKVVLAAISPALFDMFISEIEPKDSKSSSCVKTPPTPSGSGTKSSNVSYFEFSQGDYECFEALVDYAYTGTLTISSRKIADLYKTAFALQVNVVANACARHLADNLSCGNCIGIRKHANFNNDIVLVEKVDSFIADNIEKIVSDSVEFTQLPCVKVRIIVPHIEQTREDLGESLAIRTLTYFQLSPRISDRVDQQIEALVQKSHLLFVEDDTTLQDCAEMDDHSSVGSCDVVQDYKRSKQSKSSKTAGHNSQMIGTQTVQHHVTGALPVRINASRVANAKYASNESLNSLTSSATDVDDEIESKLIAYNQTSPGFWICLVVLYKRLVVFSVHLTDDEDIAGSGDSASETPPIQENTKQSIDLQPISILAKLNNCAALTRQPIPSMSAARCSVGAVFLNGKIIVCGGYDRGECLKTVEEFDVISCEWRLLPSMTTERGRFDAAVAGGKIYAVAGSNGNNDLRTAERYDPRTQRWDSIAPISRALSHNGCASLGGFIYCIGGSNDQGVLRDCERFDTEKGSWESIAPMHNGRYQAGCTTWKGMVVCVAGCDRWNCLDTVEAFDPQTGAWRLLSKLATPRRGCAVAVVRESLYVIGGHDGTQSLNSVEVLDSLNGHWRAAPLLNTARANTHAVVTAGNAIYVIGGFDGIQFLPSVEVLESESVGWRSWVQKRVSQDLAINEDDEDEDKSTKSDQGTDSITPRTAVIVL